MKELSLRVLRNHWAAKVGCISGLMLQSLLLCGKSDAGLFLCEVGSDAWSRVPSLKSLWTPDNEARAIYTGAKPGMATRPTIRQPLVFSISDDEAGKAYACEDLTWGSNPRNHY